MEEYIRKELLQICHSIIEDQGENDIEDHLSSVQILYEKLLVLNYFNSRKSDSSFISGAGTSVKQEKSSRQTQQPASVASKPEATPEPETDIIVEQSADQAPVTETKAQKEEPKPQPERINESPVPEKELTDDKTPEEQMADFRKIADTPRPSKSSSINERYGTGSISLGLNDRIAFVNHLFDGKQEDLNRVISQINTFESLSEAETFIEQMVKPDYDWSQKEEFETRFMEKVRHKFGEQ